MSHENTGTPGAPEPVKDTHAPVGTNGRAGPASVPTIATRKVRRPALLPLPDKLVLGAGGAAIVPLTPTHDFWPIRLVLHPICVRPLLIDDIRVQTTENADPMVAETKLEARGPVLAEAFIATIPENHTPDMGCVGRGKSAFLFLRNMSPAPLAVHGHILGHVEVDEPVS